MRAHDAAELKRLLAAQAPALAAHLLPAGKRHGNEWVHRSLTGTSRRSLSVHLSGLKAGVWADFATGDGGDALDLVAMIATDGSIPAALAWARAWLGMADGLAPIGRRRPASPPIDPAAAAREEEASRQAAMRIWLSGTEAIVDTPVAFYLAGRGINLAELGCQPRSLRYHNDLWNRETRRRWPAMLAAVTNKSGEMTAVHRTWLSRDAAGRWKKAPLEQPKMSLGRLAGGSVRLWRGASRTPLAFAPAGEVAAIGEGIETALSVVVACPELRVLSAVSLANMGSLALPAAITTVLLLKDDDGDNPAAQRGFDRAINHFRREGRIVKVAQPPIGKDFNDSLTAELP